MTEHNGQTFTDLESQVIEAEQKSGINRCLNRIADMSRRQMDSATETQSHLDAAVSQGFRP